MQQQPTVDHVRHRLKVPIMAINMFVHHETPDTPLERRLVRRMHTFYFGWRKPARGWIFHSPFARLIVFCAVLLPGSQFFAVFLFRVGSPSIFIFVYVLLFFTHFRISKWSSSNQRVVKRDHLQRQLLFKCSDSFDPVGGHRRLD